ncbi:MAG TPA: urate hydroxylase PuuD [Thermoanaerobaculia bacterium]|nr:urate hydroxylase PuuD [Thermoanaerobaculia bacterium]
MNYTLQEWLNLALRWTHVFSGIMWVGATYYFTWLDRRFHTTDPDQVWMVHSGGFYVVNKTKTPSPSHTLHWFKWEAAMTWLSGVPLLILVYYMGGLLVDGEPGKPSFAVAAAIGIGVIIAGWIVYDALWLSPLARHEPVAVAISFALIVALAWWLPQVMSNRAAFLHVGAVLGTIMTANVWHRIIPAQKKMVAAAREGREPDPALADRAKFRSKHNTYLVIPVVLMMISNHYPIATYGHAQNWVVLSVLTLVGWAVAHVIRKQ